MIFQMDNMPKIWEDLINSESGLPVVVHSLQRIMDGRYQVDADSVHDEFELIYVQHASRAHFEIDGNSVPIHNHDLLLIKPHIPHKLDVDSDNPCQFWVLKFCFVKNRGSRISSVSLDEFLSFISEAGTGGYFSISSIYYGNIVNAMQQIMQETKEPDELSGFMESLLVMELFVWLSRSLKAQWESSLATKGDKLHELLEAARNFILENYYTDISLDDISNYVYISTSHFARAFKKHYDISPIQYLLSVRIQKAKTMLEETNKKIGDIAIDVGFSAQQRFNDIFKKQIGMSPSEYRQHYKESITNLPS